MTHTRLSTLGLSLFTAATLSGCFGTQEVQEHYYFLQGPKKALETQQDGPSLMVADLAAAAGYDTARIAYRVAPHELRYYVHRQWVSEPARMLTEMTVRHLRASRQFSLVGQGDRVREPNAVLEGTIDAIEEVDLDNSWKGRLAVTWYLRKAHSQKILLRYSFDESLPCARRDPGEVADGISKILAMQLEKLAPRIANAMKPHHSAMTTSAPTR